MSDPKAGTNHRAPSGAQGADPRRWRALAILALVQIMIVLDMTVVNIALPDIKRGLGTTESTLAWVVNGYLVAAGGLLLLGGRLADLFGRRRIFIAGTALFAVASLACGTAVHPGVLVVSRFAQGVGEALASPAALSLVALLFQDPKERAKAIGIWGGLSGLGSTVGVVLSGVLVDVAGWRWIFLINLPIAAIALVLVPRLVSESRPRAAGKQIDWTGAVLVTTAAVALVQGLLAASTQPFTSPAVWIPLLAGLAAAVAFVVVEARSADPLVPLRFFANRTRVSANLSTVFMTSAMAAMFFLVTLYVQEVLRYTPLQSGLVYLPFCGAFLVGLTIGTKMMTWQGVKATIVTAFAIGALGMLLLTRVQVDASFVSTLLPATLVLAVGLAMGLPALQNAALHELSESDAGLGSGVQTATQQIGSALGLAVLASIAIGHAGAEGADQQAAVDGYQLAFGVSAAVLAVGGVVVLAFMQRVSTTPKNPATPADPATPPETTAHRSEPATAGRR